MAAHLSLALGATWRCTFRGAGGALWPRTFRAPGPFATYFSKAGRVILVAHYSRAGGALLADGSGVGGVCGVARFAGRRHLFDGVHFAVGRGRWGSLILFRIPHVALFWKVTNKSVVIWPPGSKMVALQLVARETPAGF